MRWKWMLNCSNKIKNGALVVHILDFYSSSAERVRRLVLPCLFCSFFWLKNVPITLCFYPESLTNNMRYSGKKKRKRKYYYGWFQYYLSDIKSFYLTFEYRGKERIWDSTEKLGAAVIPSFAGTGISLQARLPTNFLMVCGQAFLCGWQESVKIHINIKLFCWIGG